MTSKQRLQQGGYVILALLGLLALESVFAPRLGVMARAGTFVLSAIILAASFAAIGWAVNGRPIGMFIDNRNRISLSKLQAGAWTVIVLAAFTTAAAFNAAAQASALGSVTALAVVIPGDLLLAMGISATSLVATPGLLSIKSQEAPDGTALKQAQAKLGPDVSGNGKLLLRASPADANWSDLVTGEELGNAGTPDLGKIQQAIITLLLLGCYAAYVVVEFSSAAKTIDHLPTLDKSFIWLLGISHASYLAYKAAPHTQSADTP